MEDIGGLYVGRLSGAVGIVHGEDDMGIFSLFQDSSVAINVPMKAFQSL